MQPNLLSLGPIHPLSTLTNLKFTRVNSIIKAVFLLEAQIGKQGAGIMKIYIAGIMQGSTRSHGIQEQDYRQFLRDAVKNHHPDAEIYDPFLRFPDSVEYDDQRAREVLFELAAEAGASDVVIAFLPEASMGTALEMIRAYDNQKTIICISPMEKNWFINAVSTKIFRTLDEFLTWISQSDLTTLVNTSKAD